MRTVRTPEKVAQAQAMRAAGARYGEIAEVFGINPRTASMWVNDPDGSLDRQKKRREQAERPERKRAARRRSYDRHRERILVQAREADVGEERKRNRARHYAYYQKNKAALHLKRRLRNYGLTVAEYEALRDAQAGHCAICDGSMEGHKNEHIDHCHATERVRELLCSRCNTALGLVRENVKTLQAMVAYLDRHRPEDGD